MRATCAIAAAVALALPACRVDVEGARCNTPGSAAECPADQACGNDRTCTTHAAACASEGILCTPGTTADRCQGNVVETCTAADPVCGAWHVKASCTAVAQLCEAPAGVPACVGVPCSVPGATAGCPDSQGCGNDHRCSTGAAACIAAGTFCVPGASPARCHANQVQTCTGSDPVCGTWSAQQDCSATSQVCDAQAGTPACVGTPCSAPGTTAGCPTGQACGNDQRCSTAAAACVSAATFCVPGVAPNRCQSNQVQTCAGSDPVCGTWAVLNDCGASSLVCDAGTGTPACVCRSPGALEAIAADPAAPATTLTPTGAAQPPECRLRKLRDALAAAARGGQTTVKAFGAPGAPVVFAAEAFPLVVPADVTISGADAPAGETVVEGRGASPATMVTLQGTLDHVHLKNVSMTGNGVDATCGATGVPTLRDVVVSATSPQLTTGVSVSGACGASLQRVDVSGASGAALEIGAEGAAATITVSGGRLHGSGQGVKAKGGTLILQSDPNFGPTEIANNVGTGILLTGASPAIDATLVDVVVAGNGGTGIYVKDVGPTSRLKLTSCDVHLNASASPTPYGPPPPAGPRTAGGILLSQVSLAAFQMQGNLVYANHGTVGADELAFESSTGWPVTTGSCTSPSPNAFGCLKNGSLAVSVWPGTADARFTIWPQIPPTLDVSAGVSTGTSANGDGPCGTWSAVTCP